jgi:hypothetical protein
MDLANTAAVRNLTRNYKSLLISKTPKILSPLLIHLKRYVARAGLQDDATQHHNGCADRHSQK